MNASGISDSWNLHSRIENAFTALELKRKKTMGFRIKPAHIFDEYNMSKGQIDISEIILDKDDLKRNEALIKRQK